MRPPGSGVRNRDTFIVIRVLVFKELNIGPDFTPERDLAFLAILMLKYDVSVGRMAATMAMDDEVAVRYEDDRFTAPCHIVRLAFKRPFVDYLLQTVAGVNFVQIGCRDDNVIDGEGVDNECSLVIRILIWPIGMADIETSFSQKINALLGEQVDIWRTVEIG